MPEAIKPVGHQPNFIWSELLNPATVKPASLPKKAGVYVVVACDSQGSPIKNLDALAHSALSGVVYIGMTGSNNTLKRRFSALARAWRANSKQQIPSHGSRSHYNSDPRAKKLFLVENVRLRYQALPTATPQDSAGMENFATSQNLSVSDLRLLLGLEKTTDKRVYAMEVGLIQWFKRSYGYIPILNRDDDGAKDEYPTDNWMDLHFTDMEHRAI